MAKSRFVEAPVNVNVGPIGQSPHLPWGKSSTEANKSMIQQPGNIITEYKGINYKHDGTAVDIYVKTMKQIYWNYTVNT